MVHIQFNQLYQFWIHTEVLVQVQDIMQLTLNIVFVNLLLSLSVERNEWRRLCIRQIFCRSVCLCVIITVTSLRH